MGQHWVPDGNGGFVEAGGGAGIGVILFLFMGIVTIVGAPLLVIFLILEKTGILAVLGSLYQALMGVLAVMMIGSWIIIGIGIPLAVVLLLISYFRKK